MRTKTDTNTKIHMLYKLLQILHSKKREEERADIIILKKPMKIKKRTHYKLRKHEVIYMDVIEM